MLKCVRVNSDDEIRDYKVGQEMVRFVCDRCKTKKLMKLADIQPDVALCDHCQTYFKK